MNEPEMVWCKKHRKFYESSNHMDACPECKQVRRKVTEKDISDLRRVLKELEIPE